MALASTATTIVSGAMAERTNLKAYMLYSFVSTLSTCFPTHWIWGKNGVLRELGVIDIAGCSGVHLVGGAAGLAAAVMLGPRTGRFDDDKKRPQPCSMTNVMLGTFMLWWGWLGFNCGSTFGITGAKWKLASRSAVATLNGSIGGGILAIAYSYIRDSETLDIPIFVTGIRGGLVAVTGICALARPWEGLVIGFLGGLFACLLSDLMIKLRIDDPVNCVATHAGSAVWGMIAVALFVEKEKDEGFSHEEGLFKGGGWRLLGIQLLACVVTAAWGVLTTVMLLFVIEKTIGIRLTREEEQQGCDLVEHGIGEDSEDEEGEIEGKQKQERASSVKSMSTVVEKFSRGEDEEPEKRKFTGAFVMIARNLRRKQGNEQATNQEEATASISSVANSSGNEDLRTSVCVERGSRNRGAFFMKLPMMARNLRRKHENKKLTNGESNAANSSIRDAPENDEDARMSHDANSDANRSVSATETRSRNGDSRGSDDLRSIYSVDSAIEDFITQEVNNTSCYPMPSVQKRTEDKCVQVICEQGVLIDM